MSRHLALGTVFINIKLFTGLWVLPYFCSVWWDLCGTASQGFPCCPIYFKIGGQVWLVYISVFPTG